MAPNGNTTILLPLERTSQERSSSLGTEGSSVASRLSLPPSLPEILLTRRVPVQIKGAQELGAAGVLMYSDLRDDGSVTAENGYKA